MNLQEELKTLKERIAELENQAKEEQEFPQDGDTYSYINTYGGVESDIWEGHFAERNMVKIGNFFQTEEEAEFLAEKLKVEAELRKFSRPFEYGKFNHYLFLDIDGDSFRTDFTSYCPPQGAIYFESKEKVQQAIKSVGEERIKKYIFGVEDYYETSSYEKLEKQALLDRIAELEKRIEKLEKKENDK